MAHQLSPPVTVITILIDPLQKTFTATPVFAVVPGSRVLAWSFPGLSAGYQPVIDFVGFRKDASARILTDFEKPTGELNFGMFSPETGLSAAQILNGPPGEYWYKVSLVPHRGVGDQVVRLECTEYYDENPGAGLKIPPVRPNTP